RARRAGLKRKPMHGGNLKSEIRNPKQTENPKKEGSKLARSAGFEPLTFGSRICSGFREVGSPLGISRERSQGSQRNPMILGSLRSSRSFAASFAIPARISDFGFR